ncbi:MAG: hypothetical protein ACI9FB_002305 [Candidatus Azotimanducaceae bacterium]|jgi:hypothetical protein
MTQAVKLLLCTSALMFFMSNALAELPQYDDKKHLGVASCASSVCHGSVQSRASTAVRQNEYVIWSRRDRHRISYNTLLNDESKAIAKKLGLKNAHEADICLDCHADNVAVELRGPKFQIDDGIGCEGCHGGAEHYISSHVDPDTPRSETLDAGLYKTDDAHARAKLCLSCHLGVGDKMATHDIMGAGHPRISFELDTFGALQPAHYVMDKDYRESKWSGSSVELWSIGQIEASRQTLMLIGERLHSNGLFPELALFDCHSCHHSMSDQKWQANDRSNLPPGSVRLNDANFVMLFSIANVVSPDMEKALKKSMKGLHSSVNDGDDVKKRVANLLSILGQLDAKIETVDLNSLAPKIRATIVRRAAEGELNDYVGAEQAIMALDMLLSQEGKRDKHVKWLNKLYDTVADEDNFEPYKFAKVMKQFPG